MEVNGTGQTSESKVERREQLGWPSFVPDSSASPNTDAGTILPGSYLTAHGQLNIK